MFIGGLTTALKDNEAVNHAPGRLAPAQIMDTSEKQLQASAWLSMVSMNGTR